MSGERMWDVPDGFMTRDEVTSGHVCEDRPDEDRCALFWTTSGELGDWHNSCKLPIGHQGNHACVCGQETDPDTADGSYFIAG